MRLCFGTFGTVLYYCRQYTNKAVLVAKLAMALDPESSYIGINRYDLNNDGEKLIGDKAAATKLLNCEKKYFFSSQQIPSLDTVIDRLRTEINDFIDKDKKAKVILALLDIIQKDDCLDFEKKESFKVFLGMEKKDLLKRSEYDFFDFLGRILMYTALGNVDNTVGNECVKSITCEYIENVAKPYTYEYQWNPDTQKLTLTFANIFQDFQKSLLYYDVKKFIEDVDPSVKMSDDWPEKHDSFITYIKKMVSSYTKTDYPTEKIGFTLENILEFTQKFNEYTNYIGKHMNPLVGSDLLIPRLHSAIFTKEVRNYRRQLAFIYQKIYTHMIFASEYQLIDELGQSL